MACCKKITIWKIIASLSMVIACFYIGASICGLLTYHCILSPDTKFKLNNYYLTYVLYFYNYDCIDTESDYFVYNSEPSNRTWAIMITYLTVNSVWFFTSLLLFKAPDYWKTKTSLLMTYPWLVVTFLVLCLDVGASVMYGLDLEDIWGLDDLIKFVSLNYPGMEEAATFFTYVPAATIIMVSLCSKFVIGWILLLICCLTIFVWLNQSRKPEELNLQTRRNIDYYAPPIPGLSNPAFEMREIGDDDRNRLDRAHQPQDMEWDVNRITHIPHILPRARLDDNNWKMRGKFPSNGDYVREPYIEDDAPRSILKTPNTQNYPYEVQKPWSYLPQTSSAGQYPSNGHIERADSWYINVPPSAPIRQDQNQHAMYY